MGKFSGQKGSGGEREVISLFKKYGPVDWKPERNLTQRREPGPDILGVPFWCEVKRRKKIPNPQTFVRNVFRTQKEMPPTAKLIFREDGARGLDSWKVAEYCGTLPANVLLLGGDYRLRSLREFLNEYSEGQN